LAIAEEFPGEVGELAAVLVLQFLLEKVVEVAMLSITFSFLGYIFCTIAAQIPT